MSFQIIVAVHMNYRPRAVTLMTAAEPATASVTLTKRIPVTAICSLAASQFDVLLLEFGSGAQEEHARLLTKEGHFFRNFFSFFFRNYFCFSGSAAFRLFGFCGFYVGFCGFRSFSFRIICIHSSSLFASSALPVPLRQVAFWLFGFFAFWLLAAFWLWLFAS